MITTNRSDGKKIAYMKGAPEIIIKKCRYLFLKGKIVRLANKHKQLISRYYRKFASRGERVLAFAYKETKTDKAVEQGFVFQERRNILHQHRAEILGRPARQIDIDIAFVQRDGKLLFLPGD